jgi:hypothetical protein
MSLSWYLFFHSVISYRDNPSSHSFLNPHNDKYEKYKDFSGFLSDPLFPGVFDLQFWRYSPNWGTRPKEKQAHWLYPE